MERLQSSTLLDDRRDACRALKAMSRKYRVEVGAQGMDPICQVLENDRGDAEIVSYALDILCNVIDPETFPEEGKHCAVSFFISSCSLPSLSEGSWLTLKKKKKTFRGGLDVFLSPT